MVNPVPLLPGYLVFDGGSGLIADQRTIRQADPDVVQVRQHHSTTRDYD